MPGPADYSQLHTVTISGKRLVRTVELENAIPPASCFHRGLNNQPGASRPVPSGWKTFNFKLKSRRHPRTRDVALPTSAYKDSQGGNRVSTLSPYVVPQLSARQQLAIAAGASPVRVDAVPH